MNKISVVLHDELCQTSDELLQSDTFRRVLEFYNAAQAAQIPGYQPLTAEPLANNLPAILDVWAYYRRLLADRGHLPPHDIATMVCDACRPLVADEHLNRPVPIELLNLRLAAFFPHPTHVNIERRSIHMQAPMKKIKYGVVLDEYTVLASRQLDSHAVTSWVFKQGSSSPLPALRKSTGGMAAA